MIKVAEDLPISVDPEVMSGVPVFTGTRVPVSALLENLEAGISLDEFIENFPTVRRDQAVRVLEHFRTSLDARLEVKARREFYEDMKIAEKVMAEDREVLRKLADS